jgi:SAM-dependent methyltransferase
MCKFNKDYFEHGVTKGISLYENYHWMPRRSFREALTLIDFLNLTNNDYVLEIGCAKGFLTRALRTLEIKADGCDISSYALSFAPDGCWNCETDNSWEDHKNFGYTYGVIKDVLEHLTPQQLETTLHNISVVVKKMICIVPLGENGKYRISEYEGDKTHIIKENESWWKTMFEKSKWDVKWHGYYVPGLKDNWAHIPNGNCVFLLNKN